MASMFVCTACGYVGHPTQTVKGNVILELLLWCFFIVPGIIYSIWRGSTSQKLCPKCKHPTMIPSDTPMGAKLVQEHRVTQSVTAAHVTASPTDPKMVLLMIVLVALAIVAVAAWYIAAAAVVVWFLWKKTKFQPKVKTIITAAIVVLCFFAGYATVHANRAPSLTIMTPQDNASVQAQSIAVQGKVVPKRSIVKFNGQVVTQGDDGNFRFDAPLPKEKNVIQIEAINDGKTTTTTLQIVRLYTQVEKAQQLRLKAEADAKRQAAIDKAKADQAAFDASKAGKLCKQYPAWSKDDCQHVADRKIWVGMTYDMIVAVQGRKPNVVNPSNYGNGMRYQWCWTDSSPSCFYGGEDGIVTSYN